MKVAFDTNILVYAEGINDDGRRNAVSALIALLPPAHVVLPAQVLGELFNVLIRKGGRDRAEARQIVLSWSDVYPIVETSAATLLRAVSLATDHHLRIWDAVILSAAAEAGCRLLLSEDMQSGFTWAGTTIVDPFAAETHPLLATLKASFH